MPESLTESFCERCGTRYTFKAATTLNPLRRARGFAAGLRNYVMSSDSLSEAVADAMHDESESLAERQVKAFNRTFNFCMTCRQYACRNCWNDAQGQCLTCAPAGGAPAGTTARVEEAWPDHDVAAAARLAELTGAVEPAAPADATAATRRVEDLAWPEAVAPPDTQPPAPVELFPSPARSDWPVVEVTPDATTAEAEPIEVFDATAGPVEATAPVEAVDTVEASDGVAPIHVEASAEEPDEAPPLEAPPVEAAPQPEPPAEPWLREADGHAPPAKETVAPFREAAVAPEWDLDAVAAVRPEPAAPAAPGPPEQELPADVEAFPELPPERIAAALETPEARARRAQLELLGLVDPGREPVPASPVAEAKPPLPALPMPDDRFRHGDPAAARDAVWAASTRQVAATAVAPVGVQDCSSCGLALSANARFCRRCGHRQLRSA